MHERPTCYHLGFVFGPRINAGGRIGKADLGARLLSTESVGEAQTIALELDALNLERRQIEAGILDAAMALAEAAELENPTQPVLIVAGEGWHPGVIGIVASRLAERDEKTGLRCRRQRRDRESFRPLPPWFRPWLPYHRGARSGHSRQGAAPMPWRRGLRCKLKKSVY